MYSKTDIRMRHSLLKTLLPALAALALAACASDQPVPAVVQPTQTGTYTDTRDGHTYAWAQFGTQQWMTENARHDLRDVALCTIYQPADDHAEGTNTTHLPKYGRLYTYEGALAACPEGWRLPTDADWQQLEQTLGMTTGEAAARGWRGSIAANLLSMYGVHRPLNLLLGGFYDSYLNMGVSRWRMMGTLGFYWTATPDDTKTTLGHYYYYRKLAYNKKQVYRESMESAGNMLSVRYVRDAQ